MRMRRTLAYFIFASCVLLIVVKNRAAELRNEVRSGSWAISKSDEAGKVEFALMEHRRDGSSNHQSSWPASVFQGVDFSKSGRQDVRFTVARDAGKIECEGYLNDGEGAGIFHFQPDANYPHEMQSLGFTVDEEKQFAMAVQDVSLAFAREMKGENLRDLDAETDRVSHLWRGQGVHRGASRRATQDLGCQQTGGISNSWCQRADGAQLASGWVFSGRRHARRDADSWRDSGMDARTQKARLRSSRVAEADRISHPWCFAGIYSEVAGARILASGS